MLILTIRTDKPEAEIGLYDNAQQFAYETWSAHRELAETLHAKIHALLRGQSKDWPDIAAIVCFKGPGSFTGLRIGLTVGSALAYSLPAPIVTAMGDDWQSAGIQKLLHGDNEQVALPEYGAEVHITQQRK